MCVFDRSIMSLFFFSFFFHVMIVFGYCYGQSNFERGYGTCDIFCQLH
jgi:hypothetical protein